MEAQETAMTGYTKDSLAAGIPNRNIGPETGSFGAATVTNTGDTSEGTNQDHESRPAPAAGLEGADVAIDNIGERRSFSPGATGSASVDLPDRDIETVAQQIADGGDHFDPDKHLDDDRRITDEEQEELEISRREGLDLAP
jgi:hypothetical protein